MRTLKCVGTGSSGNCYILNVDDRRLILDAGLPIKRIKEGLDWTLNGLSGAIVSHAHMDHCKSAIDLTNLGIDVWTPYAFTKEIDEVVFSPFHIKCFPVPHNGVPNRGFLVRVEDWKMVYITDNEYCSYSFAKQHLNTMLIECNYTSVADDAENLEHVVRGHAGLPMVKRFVEHNATEDLQNVILCHLSLTNADPELILSEITQVVPPGCMVDIAAAGRTYEL